MENLTLYALLAYMAVVFTIAYKNRIYDDGRGFVIGGRNVSGFATASSIAAGLRDGTGIVTWITFAAAVGFGASWLILALAATMLLMSYSAPKVRKLGAELNAVTIQDIVKHKVGKRFAMATASVVFISGLLITAANLNIIGTLFSTIIGTPRETTIVITAVFVGTYLFIGGYKSVIKTDIFQLFIMLFISVIPFINMEMPTTGEAVEMFGALDQNTFIGFIGIGILYALSVSEYWQRMISAKSEKAAQTGLRLGSFFLIFITFGLLGIGMWLQQMMPEVDSANVYNALFEAGANVPVWVPTLIALIVASAVMSTIDTQVSLFSTTVVGSVFKINTTKDHMRFVRLCRFVIVMMMIVVTSASLFIGDIVQFLFDAITVVIVTAGAYIYAVHCKKYASKTRDTILAFAVLAGMATHLYMFATGMFADLRYNLIPALTVSAIIAIYMIVETYVLKVEEDQTEPQEQA